MFRDLSKRQREEEWMDAPTATLEEIEPSLQYIRKVNKYFGYTKVTLRYYKDFSRNWRRDETIRILDLGTGSADIPVAILQWADEAKFNVEVVGLDLHPSTAAIAGREKHPGLTIIRGDAMNIPFTDGSFDYVMTNMFLHHLDEADVVRVLSEMKRVSKRGVVAADLLRDRRAYVWIWLFTVFSNPMVKHDGRVSVAQAFTLDEIDRLRTEAGLDFARVIHHYGHRFAIAGERAEFTGGKL